MGRAPRRKPARGAPIRSARCATRRSRSAQTRLRTALNRLTPKDDPAAAEEITAALDELGL